jgi:hypothetical protein
MLMIRKSVDTYASTALLIKQSKEHEGMIPLIPFFFSDNGIKNVSALTSLIPFLS